MSASADHNLLFGILAVQLDFITKDALVAAMSAWLLDKGKPLGDILRDQGHLSPERLQFLSALVAEHLKQHGDDPAASLAALSSLGPVREELGQIADPDLQASLAAASRDHAADTASLRVGTGSSSGVRFRVLRPHARGSLGQVSVATAEADRRPRCSE
jgi:eukaryotic-like serine/threonine-protein kinase